MCLVIFISKAFYVQPYFIFTDLGVSLTKWAIEYEEPAGDAFKLNHPESLVFIKNCNVILR